ncbi:pyridoxal phosphate-dependent transferase [Sphaerosporella brunnea]|uniref:phosphoserine transaminase n=1 Tax=Sphaerosporella brunnea TaxID=1250544 RepID=A0A5J5EDP4_9PEZI|nr:pyridoxal phosphate-dependent transferase [Sphaerosporella brunnea]
MPSRSEISYFGAGPAALPTSVLETASAAILNHENSGVGLIEQSHRSANSINIITSACEHLRNLLNIPEGYSVLWMQGGGTTQFAAVVYNLVGHWVQTQLDANNGDLEAVKKALGSARADYLVTGSWSKKAAEEAARITGGAGKLTRVAVNAKAATGKFGAIPPESQWELTPAENSIFSYYCDNETVDGVEFPAFPAALEGRLVACDMSSNILSRRVDVSKYAILYAGAQKNVGGAGVTLVVVKDEVLKKQASEEALRALGLPVPPIMLYYPTLTGAGSLYNTLPIFDVFICREVMAGLLARGGLEVQEKVAAQKAALLYGALGRAGGFYKVVPEKSVRSRMNICFRIEAGEEVEKAFLEGAEAKGLTGLKGHRSVGGLRISNYNSVLVEAAEKLAAWIEEFAKERK